MNFSQNGRNLLIYLEGKYPRVYDDLRSESDKRQGMIDCYTDVVGTPSIGIGHVVKASWINECDRFSNHFRNGYDMSDSEMLALFEEDIARKEPYLKRLLKIPITQNQYDALFIYMFNVGQNNSGFKKAIEETNKKNWIGASEAIYGGTITSKGKNLIGLSNRRAIEAQLYLDGLNKSKTKNILIASAIISIGLALL